MDAMGHSLLLNEYPGIMSMGGVRKDKDHENNRNPSEEGQLGKMTPCERKHTAVI